MHSDSSPPRSMRRSPAEFLRAFRDLTKPAAVPLVRPSDPDLLFRTTRDQRGRPLPLRLDVYRGLAGERSDGLSCLLIHGGSFILGDRAMTACRFLATHLVRRGVTVASADYRLAQQGGVLPRPVRDVKAAMQYWAANAPRFDADPERVVIVGLSAGAALSLLALGWPDDHAFVQVPGGRPLTTPRPFRVASVYGVSEFTSFRRGITPWLRRWVTGTKDPEKWRLLSPVAWCDFDAPLFQIHGDADRVVPVEQTHAMDAARRAAGKPVETHIYPGVDHAFFSYPGCAAAERGLADLLGFVLA